MFMKFLFLLTLIGSLASSFGQALPRKSIVGADSLYTAVVDAKEKFSVSLLISKLGDGGRVEKLPLGILRGPLSENVPFKYDVADTRLYFLCGVRYPGFGLFTIRKYLVEDIRTWNAPIDERDKTYKKMGYNENGVLMADQLPVAPLNEAYRTAALKNQGGSLYWDLKAETDDDVRLYLIVGKKLSVWLAPKGEWKNPFKVPPWQKLREYAVDMEKDFEILSDDNNSVLLVTSDGDIRAVSQDGDNAVRSVSPPGSEQWLILDKNRKRRLLGTIDDLIGEGRGTLTFHGKEVLPSCRGS
jgi:hypothetical protein